ncbi:MAG: preprotein translocase subunit SecG [Gammaproteobacteria bacterium]
MFQFLLVVQVLVSISIIALVMLQQGKGADMGAAFGSGSSGTVFGARGSGSFFSRATGILAAVFFINCLLIASPLIRHTSTTKSVVASQIEQQQVENRTEPVTAVVEDLPADVQDAQQVEITDPGAAAVPAEKLPKVTGTPKPAKSDDLPE